MLQFLSRVLVRVADDHALFQKTCGTGFMIRRSRVDAGASSASNVAAGQQRIDQIHDRAAAEGGP